MPKVVPPEAVQQLREVGVVVETDIPYLGDGRAEKLDLYGPAEIKSDERRPGIVMIHGGGWSGGDKADAREINICCTLAKNGFVAVSINYLMKNDESLCWPTNLHDCKEAVRFLRANADKYQIDANHIGAIGGSAGGHLAAMLGVTDDDWMNPLQSRYPGYSSQVQAVINMYGPVDLLEAGWDMEWMLGATIADDPQLYRNFSPKFLIDPQTPPTLILHGDADSTVPVVQAILHAETLKDAGVEHELVIVEGAPHSFHFEPSQRDLRPLVLKFLRRYLA